MSPLIAAFQVNDHTRFTQFGEEEVLSTTCNSRLMASLATCVLLSACNGATSDSDIQVAIDRQIKTDMQGITALGSGAADMVRSMMPTIKSTHKIGCKEDGEKACRCDVELEIVQGNGTVKKPVSFRFVKGSEGWTASK